MEKIPLSGEVSTALARLFDDAQVDTREPSHSDLGFLINKYGLTKIDPHEEGARVGKYKRLRKILDWGRENNRAQTERFAAALLGMARSVGGFRSDSGNFVGDEAIENLRQALRREGIELFKDGRVVPLILDDIPLKEHQTVFRSYIDRAKNGSSDAALLAGTGKDLLEAVAAYVSQRVYGAYDSKQSFPMLLGHAFAALELTSKPGLKTSINWRERFESAIFESALTINNMRNKAGTGHGRPFPSDLRHYEARAAIEMTGVIAEFLLNRLQELGYD